MSEEQRIAMATALQDIKALIADRMTERVADMQTELLRIEQSFNGKMAIIGWIERVALILAVAALAVLIVATALDAWTVAKEQVGKHSAGGRR